MILFTDPGWVGFEEAEKEGMGLAFGAWGRGFGVACCGWVFRATWDSLDGHGSEGNCKCSEQR